MRRSVLESVASRGRWPFAVLARPARVQGGQNVVEYGILIATIVMVVLLCVSAFGTEVRPWFAQLAGHITTVGT
ncbi:MAG: hypothetical protein JO057_18750 [Chloroflexi bacterium]|nr:hypothetical protein [Chloroflexota bacterium]